MIGYAAPVVSLAFLTGAIVVVQGVYAKYYGIALTTISGILLVSRLFDAITDPIIGIWSDKHAAAGGSRKPFVLIGGLTLGVSSFFLFGPSGDVSAEYFLGWFLVFYLAWTVFAIPHYAWGSELTSEPTARSSVFAWVSGMMTIGYLLFFSFPMLPFFEVSEFTPTTMKWSAISASLIMAPLLFICMKIAPRGNAVFYRDHSTREPHSKNSSILRSIIRNKPLLVYVYATITMRAGLAMFVTLQFLYIDVFLSLGALFSLIIIIGLTGGLLSLRVWVYLAARLNKKSALMLGLGAIGIGVLGASFAPKHSDGVSYLICAILVIQIGAASMDILSRSLLADICDYGHWKFHENHAGLYFAFDTFLSKTSLAIGGAAAFAIAGLFGFDPSGDYHDERAALGLKIAFSWMPAILVIASSALVSFFPINERRHAIIRQRLERRAARQSDDGAPRY